MAHLQKLSTFFSAALVAWIYFSSGGVSPAQVSGSLPPELQDIVKLSQAQVPDDIIVTHIKNSGVAYHLNADEIIYLRGVNVSKEVISALV